MITEKKNMDKYYPGLGKRKSAIAQVRLTSKAGGEIVINGKKAEDYIGKPQLRNLILQPLVAANLKGLFEISVKVNGGGETAQAEAIRLGVARALLVYNPELRKLLKVEGLLTRDDRIKERKKPGLKRARRAPQWQKR